MCKKLLTTCIFAISFTANANFYIDMQKEQIVPTSHSSVPGYKLLTGDYFGKVYQVGTPFDLCGVSSEGENQAIEDAMYFILPSGWYAYIDEQVTAFPTVSWSSSDDYFLDVLGHMGKNYGLNFVVDWEQKLVQIQVDEDFTQPNIEQPTIITDSDGDREVYIYTKPAAKNGFLLKNGKIIPVTAG